MIITTYDNKWSPRPKRTQVLANKFYIQKQQRLNLHDHRHCTSLEHCSQLPCPYLNPAFDSISFQAGPVDVASSAMRRSSTARSLSGLPLRSANVTGWSRDRPWSDRALVSWTLAEQYRLWEDASLLLVLSKCRSTVTLSYADPWVLYSVIAHGHGYLMLSDR